MSAGGRKKRHERFLLEHFLDVAKIRATIVNDQDEAPDFIVQFEGRLVGIEVTQLFISHDGDNLQQVHESISSRIVSRAQQEYQASDAQHAHVSVHFAPGCDLRTLDMKSTALALAEFVKGLKLSEGQRVKWDP